MPLRGMVFLINFVDVAIQMGRVTWILKFPRETEFDACPAIAVQING